MKNEEMTAAPKQQLKKNLKNLEIFTKFFYLEHTNDHPHFFQIKDKFSFTST